MRIIGGDARGRTIVAPAGAKTRPTQDYVRESLFNIIRWDVEDARVLDLFAGTGALSLEAVSRGARSAVLGDLDGAAGAAALPKAPCRRSGRRSKPSLPAGPENCHPTQNFCALLAFLSEKDPPDVLRVRRVFFPAQGSQLPTG